MTQQDTGKGDERPSTRSYPESRVPVTEDGRRDGAMAEPAAEVVLWSKVLKYAAATVVAILLLLVLFDKVLMPWYVKLGAVEKVPNVVGMGYDDAEEQLEELGFEVKKGEPQYNADYPAGTVIMQLPYGGALTKEGRRVYLTMRRGAEMIPMLDVVGLPLREARIGLMRKGFDIGEIVYEYNDSLMRDLVYAQSVPAKVGAKPGTVVDVMISRGPAIRYTMMPSLVTNGLEEARVKLSNANLVLGVVRTKTDPGYIENTVIEQSVDPFSQVAEGSAIDLTVAVPSGGLEDGVPDGVPQKEGVVVPQGNEGKGSRPHVVPIDEE